MGTINNQMANVSGFFNPTVPSARRRFSPSIGIYRSGFWFAEGVSRRIVCSSTTQGAENLSPSESRAPRWLILWKLPILECFFIFNFWVLFFYRSYALFVLFRLRLCSCNYLQNVVEMEFGFQLLAVSDPNLSILWGHWIPLWFIGFQWSGLLILSNKGFCTRGEDVSFSIRPMQQFMNRIRYVHPTGQTTERLHQSWLFFSFSFLLILGQIINHSTRCTAISYCDYSSLVFGCRKGEKGFNQCAWSDWYFVVSKTILLLASYVWSDFFIFFQLLSYNLHEFSCCIIWLTYRYWWLSKSYTTGF